MLSNGLARCWGTNGNGQLGNSYGSINVPAGVTGLKNAAQISANANSNFTCALINDGTVKCWGLNGNGQLGDGTTTSAPCPQPSPGSPAPRRSASAPSTPAR
ncbi:MAG: hypothetical protein U0359_02590 [Byssovorax sp.]